MSDLVERLRAESTHHLGRGTHDEEYITLQIMLLAAADRIEELEAEIARIKELGYAKYLEQKFTKTGSNGFGL